MHDGLHVRAAAGSPFEAHVTALSDEDPPPVPKEVQRDSAAWPAWAYREYDAFALAATARQLFAKIAPSVILPSVSSRSCGFM